MNDKPVITASPGEMAYIHFHFRDEIPYLSWDALSPTEKDKWESVAFGVNDGWFGHFDERQQAQIRFAVLYAKDFHHGADGHNNMMIIAKMVELLGGIFEVVLEV